jgi:tRNA-dihydrouridine synthase
MDKTGADWVMLARGAIANPFLVCELLGKECDFSLKEYIIKHINLMKKNNPDNRVAVEFRKFTPYYFKGMVGVKELKNAINTATTTEQIINLIEKNL